MRVAERVTGRALPVSARRAALRTVEQSTLRYGDDMFEAAARRSPARWAMPVSAGAGVGLAAAGYQAGSALKVAAERSPEEFVDKLASPITRPISFLGYGLATIILLYVGAPLVGRLVRRASSRRSRPC
jgi:hypothetical protein